jgi:hypothetical protein
VFFEVHVLGLMRLECRQEPLNIAKGDEAPKSWDIFPLLICKVDDTIAQNAPTIPEYTLCSAKFQFLWLGGRWMRMLLAFRDRSTKEGTIQAWDDW